MRAIALTIILLALAACGGQASRTADHAPVRGLPRIVSINPCVDAVLMQVADPGQIAGISHYSQDPRATSIPLDLAARFPATSGTAEEVVALAPDLVIAGGHVAPSTIAALDRLGIALIQIGVPASVAESVQQVRSIARAARRPIEGEVLVRRIAAAVRAARTTDAARVPALIWQGGGLVPGTGTLASALLSAAGYRNMSADHGLKKWDVLPLEPLVTQPPQVLFSVGAEGREDRMLGHPVLRHLKHTVAVRAYPDRLLHCGGPTIIDAVGHLARIRRSL